MQDFNGSRSAKIKKVTFEAIMLQIRRAKENQVNDFPINHNMFRIDEVSAFEYGDYRNSIAELSGKGKSSKALFEKHPRSSQSFFYQRIRSSP